MLETKQARRGAPLSGGALLFLVFLPFALGHYLSCLLRGVNAVLAPQLQASLALTPLQLGMLTSVFFFSFALAQLPIGIALDQFGARRVQPLLMVVAALGVLLFGRGHSFTDLLYARALMGLGLGGCFMSAVKAISTWVPPGQLTAVHGYLIAIGGLGAASSAAPVELALRYTDWRGVFAALACAAVVVGALTYLLAPAPARAPQRQRVTFGSVLDVYRDRAFRDTVALVLVPHAVFFGVQGFWIGKWLSDAGGLPADALAALLSVGMGAVIVGAIGVGKIAELATRRGVPTMTTAAFGIALFVGVQCAMVCNYGPSMRLLSIAFTLLGTVTGLEYAIVSQSVPSALAGRAATCLNLLIFVGAFLVQAGFGLILACWTPNAAQQYPAQAYQAAFAAMVALQLPGLLRFFLRRRGAAAPSGKMAACTAFTPLQGRL